MYNLFLSFVFPTCIAWYCCLHPNLCLSLTNSHMKNVFNAIGTVFLLSSPLTSVKELKTMSYMYNISSGSALLLALHSVPCFSLLSLCRHSCLWISLLNSLKLVSLGIWTAIVASLMLLAVGVIRSIGVCMTDLFLFGWQDDHYDRRYFVLNAVISRIFFTFNQYICPLPVLCDRFLSFFKDWLSKVRFSWYISFELKIYIISGNG